MKRRLKWEKKLTMKELEHVKEWGGQTLAGFKKNREAQHKIKAERDAQHPECNNEPCWECRIIARKLGIKP